MTLELTKGEEFDNLLEGLFEGDLGYLIGWLIEVGEGERMRLLKKGPVWTRDDEYKPVWDQLLDRTPIPIALDTLPAGRVVIVAASVLDPKTDHCVSISVQVSDIPKGLTGKQAITHALREIAIRDLQ